MTVSAIEKSIRYVKNAQGEDEALLIDLHDAEVAEYFEELLDTLEAEQRMAEGGGRFFADFKKEYLRKRN